MVSYLRWLICLACCATLNAQDEAANSKPQKSASLVQIREVIEAVMEHHFDPPTRQQLILETLRGMADVTSQRLPSNLSSRVSSISDVDELYQLLNAERQRQLDKADPLAYFFVSEWKPNDRIIARINGIVPGGLRFVPEKGHAVDKQLAANRYVGIGVRVTSNRQSQRLQFGEVMPGGSAAAAGLLAGDIIESVEGKDTFGVSLNKVIDWIRGPEGSVVKLSIRSANAEPRDVELVRSVVAMETLRLVEQTDNDAAALIQLDRLSASTVHELRKTISTLPESVTTVILDVRGSMEGGLHYTHLLANALLNAAKIGALESGSGVRPLTTEDGTILGKRTAVLVYHAGTSGQIDWLAKALHDHGVAVYRDQIYLDRLRKDRDLLWDFMPMRQGNLLVGIATARLLAADGKPLPEKILAGTLIKYAGRSEFPKRITAYIDSEGRIGVLSPKQTEFQKSNGPLQIESAHMLSPSDLAARKELVDQIMSRNNGDRE